MCGVEDALAAVSIRIPVLRCCQTCLVALFARIFALLSSMNGLLRTYLLRMESSEGCNFDGGRSGIPDVEDEEEGGVEGDDCRRLYAADEDGAKRSR